MTFANQKNGQLVCIDNGGHLLKGTKDCGTPKLKRNDTFLYSDLDYTDTSLIHYSDTSTYTQLSVSGPSNNFPESSPQSALSTSSSSVRT